MSQPTLQDKEPAEASDACVGIAHQDLSPEQQELSGIMRHMNCDPDLMGITLLGKDGVVRLLDADRNVHYAAPLRPALIKAYLDRLPYEEEVEKGFCGVDGTKVPKEQWYNPPAGILPPPLPEEIRKETKELMEKNKNCSTNNARV